MQMRKMSLEILPLLTCLQHCDRTHFCCFKLLVCDFVTQLYETNTRSYSYSGESLGRAHGCYILFLEIFSAHLYMKGSEKSQSQETCSTFLIKYFPNKLDLETPVSQNTF